MAETFRSTPNPSEIVVHFSKSTWRFLAGPLDPPRVPAFQGQDNHTVLAELGFRPDEIVALAADGALVSASLPAEATTGTPAVAAPPAPTRHPSHDDQPSTLPTATEDTCPTCLTSPSPATAACTAGGN